MFNLSMKSLFGYASPLKDEQFRTTTIEREGLLLSTTQVRSELWRQEIPEVKRTQVTPPVTEQQSTVPGREVTVRRERTSLDVRRKDSLRAPVSTSPDESHRWETKADVERKQLTENGRGRIPEKTSDRRETASVKERTSIESKRRRTVRRGRAYSASAQDVSTLKQRSDSRPDDKIRELGGALDHEKREIIRGRGGSIARRDARSFEFDPIIDGRSIERSRKRRDGSVVRDPLVLDLVDHNNTLKKVLETTQDNLKTAEQKKIELYSMHSRLRDEKAQLLERESAALNKERELQQKLAELQVKNRRLEDEIRLLRERLRSSEDKNSQTTTLLQVRTADLRGAEAFLTTANQYSGSDIINMVQILNAEIFQAAAYMAELLEDSSTMATEEERRKMLQKYSRSLEEARQEIGEGLFAYCADRGPKIRSEPLPLQLALQSLFSRWCAVRINRFSSSDFNGDLLRLYQEIQKSEPQAVTGRWRSITYANVKTLDNLTHSDQVLDMAISLLCLCGWSLNSPRSQKAILSMQQMVNALEKLRIQIKSATKECITASDIDVSAIDFDKPYDETKMEDSYRDASSGKSKAQTPAVATRVLCTVAIGLKRTVMKAIEGMPPERHEDILIKPKVALDSILRDIIDIVPDKRSSPTRGDGR